MEGKKFAKRGAGILLHISSLPSKYGIGALGKNALRFIDFLAASKQTYWQILPLSPVGCTNSPYQSNSAFAFNPFFIDLDILYEKGLLSKKDLQMEETKQNLFVDFDRIHKKREQVLRKAFSCFDRNDSQFLTYKDKKVNLDYACYRTLKTLNNGLPWHSWQKEYKCYSSSMLKRVQLANCDEMDFHLFCQFEFEKQWQSLKEYANSKKIRIIGDMPIYLDFDSVDSWANPKLLQLDKNLMPSAVAGVPPDYFSKTGQLWGNPIYDWEYHASNGYSWWKKRINRALKIQDYVRIDHFRGFCDYYSILPNAKTAAEGEWREGAGVELFRSLGKSLKERIIAEDLGLLDQRALDFFSELAFPGMKVLQFAFDGNPNNPHLPNNCSQNSVVYTGTHDNNTLMGWLASIGDYSNILKQVNQIAKEIGIEKKARTKGEVCSLIIEIALASPSLISIVPLQDYMKLGEKHRMNTPGTVNKNNWAFRLQHIPDELSNQLSKWAIEHKR